MEILEKVGLADTAFVPVSTLPQGSRKRMELALTLASDPVLLLLDEPTAGLSAEEKIGVISLIGNINQSSGLTIVFIEHDMDIVFDISQRIRVMHEGSIIMEGKPTEVSRDKEVRRIYLGFEE